MATLDRSGISIDAVTAKLVEEGVQLFADAFDKLLGAVARKRAANLGEKLDSQTYKLPAELEKAVSASLEAWRHDGNVRRLWAGDAGLWTGSDEAKWLGWLDIAEEQRKRIGSLASLAEDIRQQGFSHIVLLGMGGSSLGPEVFAETFGRQDGRPELLVLDSTDPAQIRTVESKIDPARTLFIVSSKSGSTLEPNILKQYFFECAKRAVGADKAGSRFIAITDPGSTAAEDRRTRSVPPHCVWHSEHRRALFGAVGFRPGARGSDGTRHRQAARRNADDGALLRRQCAAGAIIQASCSGPSWACWESRAATRSPSSPRPALPISARGSNSCWPNRPASRARDSFRSTPSRSGRPTSTGTDRLFVYVRLSSEADAKQDDAVAALERAGHPVVRIAVTDRYHIGQEFFRWEFATAVAGSILGINPFDQPDVEASKDKTRELTAAYERTGKLPPETALLAGRRSCALCR